MSQFPRTAELLDKFFKICEALGRPLNGLDKATLQMALKNENTEQVLEILDTMDQYEKQLNNNPFAAGPPTIAPSGVYTGSGNVTMWTSDSTAGTKYDPK